jgi:3',5'-cyclic AMP phosphodiesterase CpdA
MFILSLISSGVNISAQEKKPLIQFGIIADIQYADCEPGGTRFYRNSLHKLDDCVNYLNDSKVQFTINLGDVIDRNFADLDSVLVRLKRLKNKVYNTTGNHDYHGITDNRILYDKLDMPSEYYSFKKKNWVFILLNTNEISSYANVMGTEKERELTAMRQQIKSSGGIQGAEWNGGVGKKQLPWLNNQLAKAEKSGDCVLVFTHHPLYPKTGFTALNNMEILDVIGNYSCVKAVFSGHHHTGSFAYYKNIPVVTVEGLIETENENAFGIIKIYNNKIVLEGNGRMTSRDLNYNN